MRGPIAVLTCLALGGCSPPCNSPVRHWSLPPEVLARIEPDPLPLPSYCGPNNQYGCPQLQAPDYGHVYAPPTGAPAYGTWGPVH